MSTMKNEIIDKLWNDRPLTTDEIFYLSKNLGDNITPLPFNHTSNDEDFRIACGVTTEDENDLNKKFREALEDSEMNTDSKIIERLESFAGDPRFLRLIVIQCALYAKEKNLERLKQRRNSRDNPWM